MLTSVQLAIVTAALQILIVWGVARELDLLRPIIVVTISTLTITRTTERGPALHSGWAGIQGSYFRFLLLLISFSTVIYAVAARPTGRIFYLWDVVALVVQLIVSHAALTYARETT